MKAIICAAGMGTRLGLNIPKCLVKISNKSLLLRQIDALKDFEITIIVGYKSELILEEIKNNNIKNINIIYNNNFEDSNTTYSISLAPFNEDCLILDSDLIFSHEEISKINFDNSWVGVSDIKSSNPVYASTYENMITDISPVSGSLEWACICYLNPRLFDGCKKEYVYQIINKNLPIKFNKINIYEIDTPQDLIRAESWINFMMK